MMGSQKNESGFRAATLPDRSTDPLDDDGWLVPWLRAQKEQCDDHAMPGLGMEALE
jgi:hypothetical protein